MKLAGKKVVITGASSGIGAATLPLLLEKGAEVVVADLNPDDVPDAPNQHKTFCDVSDPDQVDQLFEFALDKLGEIDMFIANAGFAYYEKPVEENWARTEAILRTNFISPVYSAMKMARINQGRKYQFVMTASAMAKLAIPGYSTYAATKAALDKFSYAYRYEKDDQGVLTVVYPIATRTKFFNAAGNSTPVPWPSQEPCDVAHAIIRGIEKEKKAVYPSKTFVALMAMDRFVPFALDAYAKVEHFKLKRWLSKL